MAIPVITIDGPGGAGKGTVSRLVAKKLGWHYLDSGSIYRSLAIAVLNEAIALDDEVQIIRVASQMNLSFECADDLIVKLDGENISQLLALETTGYTASVIAPYSKVRQVLLKKQQDFRQLPGLVADGRDMGTVVFADAKHKVFLTASTKTRAERRYKQLIEKGIDANLCDLIAEIDARDKRDSERKVAPLVMAKDALYIDSSDMSIEAVVEEVLNLIH